MVDKNLRLVYWSTKYWWSQRCIPLTFPFMVLTCQSSSPWLDRTRQSCTRGNSRSTSRPDLQKQGQSTGPHSICLRTDRQHFDFWRPELSSSEDMSWKKQWNNVRAQTSNQMIVGISGESERSRLFKEKWTDPGYHHIRAKILRRGVSKGAFLTSNFVTFFKDLKDVFVNE